MWLGEYLLFCFGGGEMICVPLHVCVLEGRGGVPEEVVSLFVWVLLGAWVWSKGPRISPCMTPQHTHTHTIRPSSGTPAVPQDGEGEEEEVNEEGADEADELATKVEESVKVSDE